LEANQKNYNLLSITIKQRVATVKNIFEYNNIESILENSN